MITSTCHTAGEEEETGKQIFYKGMSIFSKIMYLMKKHKTFNHVISYSMSIEALSTTDGKKQNTELTVKP